MDELPVKVRKITLAERVRLPCGIRWDRLVLEPPFWQPAPVESRKAT